MKKILNKIALSLTKKTLIILISKKNYMITLIEAEKVFHKTLIHNKNIKLANRNRRDILNLIKSIYKNPTTNILNDERLNIFLLRSGTRKGLSCPTSLHCSGHLVQCNYATNQGHIREGRSDITFYAKMA